MSPRPKHRGYRPPGLFGFTAGDPTDLVDEVPDNPKHRPCPACGAQRGEPCSRPSKQGGRQPLRAVPGDPLRRGFHPARAVIPDPPPEDVPSRDDPGPQHGAHEPEPTPPDFGDLVTDPTAPRPAQPPQPPPTARAKADLRWAMNL